MKQFVIKEYGRSELASLYSPDIEPMSAWKKVQVMDGAITAPHGQP